MFQGAQSILLPFDLEDVYKVAETYPCFVRFFLEGSRIIEQNDFYMSVEVYAKLMGFLQSRWLGEGRKDRCKSIEFTQTEGLFKGLKAFWSFKRTEGGTLVSISTTFQKINLIFGAEWLLGKLVVEKTTRKILLELGSALKMNYKERESK